MAPTITDLFVYPIKSCHGIPLQSAAVAQTGFMFDRHWLVVNASTGRFLTQRQNERMALIRPELPPEAMDAVQGKPGAKIPIPASASLTVTAQGMPDLKVPLNAEGYRRNKVMDVGVWAWKGVAHDAGDEAASWLETFLGGPYRLARFIPGETLRNSDEFYSPGYDLAFSDEVPYMVISKASVRELSSWLPSPIPFTRFRPNIVLDGGEPFEEDRWRAFTLGNGAASAGREFRCVKPRARCKITTIDQETASVGSEPLATLRNLRSGAKLDLPKALKFGGYFGMNTVCYVSPEFQAAAAKDPSIMNVVVGQEVNVTHRAARVGDDIGTLWGA